MRHLIAAALLGSALAATAAAQDKKPALGVGDAAPPLKVTKWVQGEAVPAFEKDKVYIVEFWATWCGPCIGAMPHLTEIQKEYKDKGLVVIGLTSKDERGNDQKSVEEFVTKNGKKFDYRFAYCDDRATDKAYMEAAGQDGIPCSFVIGKDGKVAYIGHPMELDDVLPQIVAGTWKGKESMDAITAGKAALGTIFQSIGKAEEDKKFDAAFAADALTKLADAEAKHPTLAGKDDVTTLRLVLSVKAGKAADAEKTAAAMLTTAAKKKGQSAMLVAQVLTDKTLNPTPTDAQKKMAAAAVETALKIDAASIRFAIDATNVYLALGDKAKAKENGDLAIKNAAAEGPEAVKQVQAVVEKLLAEKK